MSKTTQISPTNDESMQDILLNDMEGELRTVRVALYKVQYELKFRVKHGGSYWDDAGLLKIANDAVGEW